MRMLRTFRRYPSYRTILHDMRVTYHYLRWTPTPLDLPDMTLKSPSPNLRIAAAVVLLFRLGGAEIVNVIPQLPPSQVPKGTTIVISQRSARSKRVEHCPRGRTTVQAGTVVYPRCGSKQLYVRSRFVFVRLGA